MIHFLLFSMACATSPRPEPLTLPPPLPEVAVTFDDAVFQITYLLDSAEGFSLVAGTKLQLEVSKKPRLLGQAPEGAIALSYRAGCNQHSAGFSVERGKLVSLGWGRSTQMGCDASHHQQDAWIAEFLSSGPQIIVVADRINLVGDQASLHFLNKKLADPDRPLEGLTWIAQRYIEEGSVGVREMDSFPSLNFANGQVDIFDSCNQLQGNYVLNSSLLRVTGIVAKTDHTCGEGNVAETAQHYAELFTDGDFTVDIDANVLTLKRENNGIIAVTD